MKTFNINIKCIAISMLTILLLIFSVESSAQYYSLGGIVHHKDKTPFEGVAIIISDTSTTIFSHSNGSFRIDSIPVSNNTITFRFLQFELTCQNDFQADKLYNLDVMFHLKKQKKSYCKLESVRDLK